MNRNGRQAHQARILVAYPSGDHVYAAFSHSLARMMAHTALTLVGPDQPIYSLDLMNHRGTLIAPQRYDIAKTAIATGVTHILWIDSDTEFPRDALNRLLARNKDYVGIVQSGRRPPCATTAFIWETPERPTAVYNYPESTGLQRVDGLGFGFTLSRIECFTKVPEPWFPMQWGHTTAGEWAFNGEDTGYQAWLRKAGFEMYVDHDLSKECIHWGAFPYTPNHALAMQDAMREEGKFIIPDAPLTEYRGGKDLVPDKSVLVEA